ncbi:hypothetical protein SE19_02790 [Acidiplasma aeolicum]|uniref:Multipass membrane protein n=1 Tax=Acidiplasma aeolicum TaxID=507754 RepID=A0A0P9CVQ1_9ARCH|nr:hypothetical protein [Acidiplasma aeolicum]KPV47040.1 hypothetical protein SE19_02790 [Acidiplasma aeolicum]KQB34396.1 hypothetical protein AOG54_01040 [Acidiplasma aeolicum]
MEVEKLFTVVFPGMALVMILAGFLDPKFWPMLLQWLVSGNAFLMVLAASAFLIVVVGGIVLIYYAMIALVFILIFSIFVLAPLHFLYLVLGFTYSVILAVVIGAAVLLYLVETRTVKIEHHTITLSVHRKFIVKR